MFQGVIPDTMNVERAEDLYVVLTKEIPDDPHNFYMSTWCESSSRASCGTVACAFGWFAKLRPQYGLTIQPNGVPALLTRKNPNLDHDLYGYYAAARVFGIPIKTATYIFAPDAYRYTHETSKHDVAARVRELIDAFKAEQSGQLT